MTVSDEQVAALNASFIHLQAAVESMDRQANASLALVLAALDTSWLTQCAASILLMQIGFAMLESGAVREQNAVATWAKNILDLTTGTLIASFWGYQLAYGVQPFNPGISSADKMSFFLYLTFQATAATIVSGAMAERTTLRAYLIVSAFLSGVLVGAARVSNPQATHVNAARGRDG